MKTERSYLHKLSSLGRDAAFMLFGSLDGSARAAHQQVWLHSVKLSVSDVRVEKLKELLVNVADVRIRPLEEGCLICISLRHGEFGENHVSPEVILEKLQAVWPGRFRKIRVDMRHQLTFEVDHDMMDALHPVLVQAIRE